MNEYYIQNMSIYIQTFNYTIYHTWNKWKTLDHKPFLIRNTRVVRLNRRLCSFLLNKWTHVLQFSLTFNSTPCANTHKITRQNNNNKRFYKTFNNTMYTGAAQADVTTAAVKVILMSRTKQHTISLMWRINLIKVSNIQSNPMSVHVWHTQVRC